VGGQVARLDIQRKNPSRRQHSQTTLIQCLGVQKLLGLKGGKEGSEEFPGNFPRNKQEKKKKQQLGLEVRTQGGVAVIAKIE